MPVELGKWNNVKITRDRRYGTMVVNGNNIGDMTSQGEMEDLTVGNDVFLGGYADGQLPTSEVQAINFEGCIEEVYWASEKIDLSVDAPGAYGVQPGCNEAEVNLVTFPAAKPGYMQLNSLDLQDQIELSFMFRTSQSRALLLYMDDTSGIPLFYIPGHQDTILREF